VLIADVVDGGPADSAGIEAGDVVTALAGRRVTAPTALSGIILTKKPGMRISVAWIDGAGQSRTATVTLASGPPQ
jgi:S1-C subfamily serine protease